METLQQRCWRGNAHVSKQAGQLERGAAVGPPQVVLFAASERPGLCARLEARVRESDLAGRRGIVTLVRRSCRRNVATFGDPETVHPQPGSVLPSREVGEPPLREWLLDHEADVQLGPL